MRCFDWDDQNITNDLAPEFEYTRVYKENENMNRAIREAKCLAVCLPASALPVEKGDWFVGRKRYRPLGISPSYWNDETDGLDHISYYADLERLARVMNREDQTEEKKRQIADLIAFWENEHVNAKARASFDEEMLREMPSDRWTKESGAIFGLYRLGGAQLDYDKLVRLGIPGLRNEIENRRLVEGTTEEQDGFLQGLLEVLNILVGLLKDYEKQLEALLSDPEWDAEQVKSMISCVQAIQVRKPESFQEALQLVWIYAAFSGTLDFGRLDECFGDLYVHDMDNGVIDHDKALTLLLSFYQLARSVVNRDTRIILGGLGRRNEENADRFALIAMEASGIHRQVQPQVSLRMYKGMSPVVRKAAMDFLELGLSYPLLYNDEASVEAVMKSMKVPYEEAIHYGFFGCGEYVLDKRSMGTPNDIINLTKVLEVTLHEGYDPVGKRLHGLNLGKLEDFETFDQLMDAYKKQAEYFIRISARHHKLVYDVVNQNGSMLMTSMLMHDCIARGKALLDGGIRYLAGTYETYGNITTADSMTAIKRIVYDEKKLTLRELVDILDKNFEGAEDIRQELLAYPKFGNGDAEADSMAQEINEHVFRYTAAQAEVNDLASYLVVMINNDANSVLGRKTLASADGRLAFTYMSNGNGPTAGMDQKGITALIRSVASTDMSLTAGTAQNIKLSRELFFKNRDAINSLIDTAYEMGILSLSISVMNKGDMEQALIHPEKYQNLFVRVGGFSARFIELDPETQRDMFNRTLY